MSKTSKTTKTTVRTKTVSILASLLLLSTAIGFSPSYAETPDFEIGPIPCVEILGGTWNSDTCTVVDYVNEGKLTVPEEVTLKIIGKFENLGYLVVDKGAFMILSGWGTSHNGKMVNEGVLLNNGTIDCQRCGFINQNTMINSGLINNQFRMSSNGTFYNFGTVVNGFEFINRGDFYSCLGEVTGNPIIRNPIIEIC